LRGARAAGADFGFPKGAAFAFAARGFGTDRFGFFPQAALLVASRSLSD